MSALKNIDALVTACVRHGYYQGATVPTAPAAVQRVITEAQQDREALFAEIKRLEDELRLRPPL